MYTAKIPGADAIKPSKPPVPQLNVLFEFGRHVPNALLGRIVGRFPGGVRLGGGLGQFRQKTLKIVGPRHEIRFAIQFQQHRGLPGWDPQRR
jgi:hypothetical protein